MKTEQINSIMGIILKGVTIISIVILTITVIKWQNTIIDTGRYQYIKEDGGWSLFNPKTGEIILLYGNQTDTIYRRKLDLLNKDINNVLGKIDKSVSKW